MKKVTDVGTKPACIEYNDEIKFVHATTSLGETHLLPKHFV